jgi:phage tail sheath protein FI
VLDDVVDLWVDVSDSAIGELYAQGVNCIRTAPGGDIRVWGARTLSTSADWRDITTRRTVLTVVRWIEWFLAGLVYEPNGPPLWARITRELTAFLDAQFTRGALRGQTAEEAFFVRCDGETNPAAGIEAGRVVTRIGLAVSRPAEFIVVRVRHDAGGVTVEAA